MNTPTLRTDRLILRKFIKDDLEALFEIFSDEEVNVFLPWYPLETMEDASLFYSRCFESKYQQECSYNYAICLKDDNYPTGYVNVDTHDSYDLGYGLRKEFWHKGIITEACRAVIEQLKKDGIPYITATHDVSNTRSGEVMRKLGMKYQYSYEEQWQPKDFLVTFRLYQLNLDGKNRTYKKYWNSSIIHFVESNV
ncbi:GNAT family N-acetyltransferase [Lachnospiraceae bacterium 62-26]